MIHEDNAPLICFLAILALGLVALGYIAVTEVWLPARSSLGKAERLESS